MKKLSEILFVISVSMGVSTVILNYGGKYEKTISNRIGNRDANIYHEQGI